MSFPPSHLRLCHEAGTFVGSEDLAGGLPRQQAHKPVDSGFTACDRRLGIMNFGL
jgi:hypothetical protein